MRLMIDEARNSEAQGFERRVRCDQASQLRRLPTAPERRNTMDISRLS